VNPRASARRTTMPWGIKKRLATAKRPKPKGRERERECQGELLGREGFEACCVK
jgi:hypothetical protein